MIYKNETEIAELTARFEAGAISREDWRHHEHMTVALYYISKHGRADALEKMRTGIHGLLTSFGLDPFADDTPYHETLTVFWIEKVADYYEERTPAPLHEIDAAILAEFDKDLPLRYYSREHLFSERARREFVAPDLA